ncbi:MAG: TonB-dependent receptor [Pseudomonadota bacterium]
MNRSIGTTTTRNCTKSGTLAMLMGGAAAIALIVAPVSNVNAQAAGEVRTYAIPAGPLEDQLARLAQTAGITFSYDPALVQGASAQPLTGDFTAEDALANLLAGSGIDYQFIGENTVTLERLADAGSGAAEVDGDVIEMNEIVVQGFQNSLFNRLPLEREEIVSSVEVIDREDLDRLDFTNVFRAPTVAPNVITDNVTTEGTPNYLVRGLDAEITVDNRPNPSIGLIAAPDSSFVESLEVLRGPASITFGPQSPGGIVNAILKRPETEDFVEVRGAGSQLGTLRTELDANAGSLFGYDSVRARLNFAYEDEGFARPQEDREIFAIRGIVEADITDRTRLQLSASYRDVEIVAGGGFAVFEDGSIPTAFTPENTFFGVPVESSGDNLYVSGEFQQDILDNLELVVRGNYVREEFSFLNAQGFFNDEGEFGGIPLDDPQFGNFIFADAGNVNEDVIFVEGQLRGDFELFGNTQDFTIGGSYTFNDQFSDFGFGDLVGTVDPLTGETTLTPPFNFDIPTTDFVFASTEDLFSVYAEAAFRPTDWLTIPVGIRFDDFEEVAQDPLNNEITGTVEESQITFRAGISAEYVENHRAYFSYATTFLPQDGFTAAGTPVGPETGENFEFGFKGSFFDGGLEYSASFFRLIRDDVAVEDPNNDGINDFFFIEGGQQTIQGIELSASGRVTENFSIFASYGFLDAEFTDDTAGELGETVPETARHNATVFGLYEFDGKFDGLRVGAGFRYLSSRAGPTNSDISYDGYVLFDAQIGYRINEHIDLQLTAQNILDTAYFDSVGSDGDPASSFDFGPPLTVLGTVKVRF